MRKKKDGTEMSESEQAPQEPVEDLTRFVTSPVTSSAAADR